MDAIPVRHLKMATLVCFLVSYGFASGSPRVTIIASKGSFASIPNAAVGEETVNWWDADLADDRACTECFAAVELANFLPQCTELAVQDIHLSTATRLPMSGDVFLLGSAKSNPLIAAIADSGRRELRSEDSFRILTFLDNDRIITVIEGKDRVGVVYGVYAYLQQLGIRFYGLEDQGTVYPHQPAELPRELHITENPDFQTRGFWSFEEHHGNVPFFTWMARNRMNLWTGEDKRVPLLKKLGVKLTLGGHIIQKYFLDPFSEYPYNHLNFQGDEAKPADPYAESSEFLGDKNHDGQLSYFEAHPEWYGLIDGDRSDNIKHQSGDNYCTSNADATKELAKNLIKSLSTGAWRHVDMVNFWMLDNGKWCQCENCQRQGTYTDRLLDVCYMVLSELRKARDQGQLNRPITLLTLAYHETLPPPTRSLPQDFDYENFAIIFFPIERCYVHSFADPRCTEVNQILLDNYLGWANSPERMYAGSLFIGEYYNVSSIKSLPVLYTRIMAADIPWYYKNGARHFHYMHTPTRLWGTWTLNQVLFARLLWNIDADVDNLLNEFFQWYYPTTSAHTRKFYQHLEKATANIKPLKHYVGVKGVINIGGERYVLRNRLTDRSKELFPLQHFRYDKYTPVLNDGPDLTEIMESMHSARRELDAALAQCSDEIELQRLLEDEKRFRYGEAMFQFYYHIVRTALFYREQKEALARQEFCKVEALAQQLQEITNVTNVSSSHASAENGMDATQAQKAYEFFKKKYGS